MSSDRIGFGPFDFDRRTGELWNAGRPVKLQEKPRQILMALLEQPGELVSRETLRRRLWGDDMFVDFDNGLNVAVRKIREAVGDLATPPRYVETLRGQGYRFIADVRVAAPAAMPPEPPQQRPALSTRWASVAATVVVGLVAVMSIAMRPSHEEARVGSIAVLPFGNHLGDEASLLVDGFSESLTAALASRVQMPVIASQSAFSLRNNMADLHAVAARLGVDAVVVGDVERRGSRVVISVRLVDADGLRTRWSGRFERDAIDDLWSGDDIVSEILVNIEAPRAGAPPQTRHVRPEAREAFLRGRFFWAKRGQANAVIASKYLSSAIELQRDYAEAWAALADVYAVNAGAPSSVIVPWPGNAIDAGIIAAREALRLSPELGEAHAALGKLLSGKLQFADAERSLREAVRLNPQYSTARQWLGTLLGRLRRCDEARIQVEIGARLDPLTALVNEAVGSVYLQCGEPERALAILDAVLQMHPTAMTTQIQRGRALVVAGRSKEALGVLHAVHQPDDAESFTTAWLLKALADAGERDELRSRMARLRAPYLRGVAAAAVGDRAGLYENLERALESADRSWLTGLLTEPAFAPYLGEARFADVAARAGFPLPIPAARFTARPTDR